MRELGTPQTLLQLLIRNRDSSYEAVVRELEKFARQHGIDGTISARHLQRLARRERTTPSGQPSALPSTRRLLAEFFGRPFLDLVSPLAAAAEDAGRAITGGLAVPQLAYPTNREGALDKIGELATADLADNRPMGEVLWSPDLAAGVITGYLLDGPASSPNEEPLHGSAAAVRIRDFTATLMELDFRHGGGATRRSLLHYFHDEVLPVLQVPSGGAVQRDVFSAAAEVAQLLGWTAYDAGRHGAATHYFVHGLRLAHEAGDRLMGGRLLSNLSHQANFLGKSSDAVRFARAAQHAAGSYAPNTVRAMLLSMEARGLASMGDAKGCAQVLHHAEVLFDGADSGADPAWISYFNVQELAGEAAHCFRDLGHHEQAREFAIRAIDPVHTPPRTKAFIDVVLASAVLGTGELEEAIRLGTTALDVAGALQSHRSLTYFTDFRRSLLESHPRHPLVLGFADQARTAYPDKLAG